MGHSCEGGSSSLLLPLHFQVHPSLSQFSSEENQIEHFQHFSPGCISSAPALLTALQDGAKRSRKGGDKAGHGNLQHPRHHRPLHAGLPPPPPLPLSLQAGHLQGDCHLPCPHGDHHNHHWFQSQWRCQLQDQGQPTYWQTILNSSQEERKSVAQFYQYVNLINKMSMFISAAEKSNKQKWDQKLSSAKLSQVDIN